MNDGTWLKLHRRIIQWEWFTDSKTLHVFIYLLLRANIKTGKMNGSTIRRGQVVTSYPRIAAATGMSVSSARRVIDNLVSTGEIISEPTNKYNLITIVKYETYQAHHREYERSNEQSDEQTTEQHHKNNKKNIRKKRDPETNHHAPKAPIDLSELKTEEKPDVYIPQYFELNIPKQYFGRFETEDEWWEYVEKNREEVERAYEL